LTAELRGRSARALFVGVILEPAQALPEHRQLARRLHSEDLGEQRDSARRFRLVEMFEQLELHILLTRQLEALR